MTIEEQIAAIEYEADLLEDCADISHPGRHSDTARKRAATLYAAAETLRAIPRPDPLDEKIIKVMMFPPPKFLNVAMSDAMRDRVRLVLRALPQGGE